MHELRSRTEAERRRLLRLLLLRLGEVPSHSGPKILLQLAQDIEVLAAHFLRVFPALDEKHQKIALALYSSLSQGRPVSAAALASAVRLPEGDVVERLSDWPGVYYDKSRHVIGFWGLTIVPMPHRLRSNGIALYAWCAWDTLFLPELIGGTLDVESTCRGTGQAVRLTATPAGVH